MSPPGFLTHAAFVLVAVVLPAVAYVQGVRAGANEGAPIERLEPSAKIGTYWTNSLVLWVLASLAMLGWTLDGGALAELGLGPRELGGAAWMLALVLVLYAFDTAFELRSPRARAEARRRWQRDTPFMPATRREIGHYLVLAVSAGFCEELLFRGLVISYLRDWVGAGPPFAVVLPALVFAVGHRYQGWRAVARIALMAGLFGWFYVATGALWPLVAVHALIDVVGGLLGPLLMRG